MHKAEQDRAIADLLANTSYHDPEGVLDSAQDTDRDGLLDSEAIDDDDESAYEAALHEDMVMVTRDVHASLRREGGRIVAVKAHRQRFRKGTLKPTRGGSRAQAQRLWERPHGILGDQLDCDDPSHPANQARLADLGRLSDSELEALRDNGTRIHLVARDLGGLLARHPELVGAGLGADTRGLHVPRDYRDPRIANHIFVFGTDEPPGYSEGLPPTDPEAWGSTLLHEIGHAYDHMGVFGQAVDDHAERINQWRRGGAPVLSEYLRGTEGDSGRELLAEGFAWLRAHGWESTAEHFFDDDFPNWLEASVKARFSDAHVSEAARLAEAATGLPVPGPNQPWHIFYGGMHRDGVGPRMIAS